MAKTFAQFGHLLQQWLLCDDSTSISFFPSYSKNKFEISVMRSAENVTPSPSHVYYWKKFEISVISSTEIVSYVPSCGTITSHGFYWVLLVFEVLHICEIHAPLTGHFDGLGDKGAIDLVCSKNIMNDTMKIEEMLSYVASAWI